MSYRAKPRHHIKFILYMQITPNYFINKMVVSTTPD